MVTVRDDLVGLPFGLTDPETGEALVTERALDFTDLCFPQIEGRSEVILYARAMQGMMVQYRIFYASEVEGTRCNFLLEDDFTSDKEFILRAAYTGYSPEELRNLALAYAP